MDKTESKGEIAAKLKMEPLENEDNKTTESLPAIELVCIKEEAIEIFDDDDDDDDDEEFEFKFDLTTEEYLTIIADLKPKTVKKKRIRNRNRGLKRGKPKFDGVKQDCPQIGCKKTFVSTVKLQEHLELHKLVSCCHLCGMIVEGQPELHKHVKTHSPFKKRTVYEGKKQQYCCDLCGKEFKKRASLTVHMETHEDKYVDCEWCGRTLKNEQILRDHIQLHITVKEFICELCGREFSNEQLYIKHGPQHSTNHAFKCNVCSMSFNHQSTLCKHTKIHSKLINCDYCGENFSYDSLYRRHLIEAHDDIKAIKIPRPIVKINYRNFRKGPHKF